MKGILAALLLGLFAHTSAIAHPAADTLKAVLDEALEIVNSNSSDRSKANRTCRLLGDAFYSDAIATELLGDYVNLERDRRGIQNFYALLPSVVVSELLPNLDRAKGGSFSVNDRVRDRGGNTVEVRTRVVTGDRKSYNLTVVMFKKGNDWLVVDGEYFGFSAVGYVKRDLQRSLDAEYRKDPRNSLPVSAIVNEYTSDPDFIRCP